MKPLERLKLVAELNRLRMAVESGSFPASSGKKRQRMVEIRQLLGWVGLTAPNGKPSKLNAVQHAQVRTPEFKAFFGDWEQAIQPPIEPVELNGDEIGGQTPKEARANAKAFIGRLIQTLLEETGIDTLHNDRTGFDIRLTEKGIAHGFQHKGPQHVKAVAGIKRLIENAAKIATKPHEPVTPEWKSVHTLVAPLRIGNDWFSVKLTVKEGKNGFRLYDHQALDMAKPDGIYGPLTGNAMEESAGKLGDRPASGLSVSIDHLLTAFQGDNTKYLASKAVDENGEPMVVYHGTINPFDVFEASEDGGFHFGNIDQAATVLAFKAAKMKNDDFAKLPELEGGMHGYMLDVFLSIKKPKRTNDMQTPTAWKQTIAKAKRDGYDGIVYVNDYEKSANGLNPDSWIAFEHSQIKSSMDHAA